MLISALSYWTPEGKLDVQAAFNMAAEGEQVLVPVDALATCPEDGWKIRTRIWVLLDDPERMTPCRVIPLEPGRWDPKRERETLA